MGTPEEPTEVTWSGVSPSGGVKSGKVCPAALAIRLNSATGNPSAVPKL